MFCGFVWVLLAPLSQDIAPVRDRAVDYISVRNQQPLFGFVLEHDGRRPTIVAVQRAWLRRERPKHHEAFRRQEQLRAAKQRELVITRIRTWMQERAADTHLVEFLQEQLDGLLAEPQRPTQEPQTQFMLVQIDPEKVRRVQRARRGVRTIAWLACRERLANVETRSAESLGKELADLGVKVPQKPVNLSDRIPGMGDNAEQWAGRQAIIEQLYRDPVKMKGTPDLLFRESSDGKPVNTQAMLAKMMQRRMNSLIEEFTEPNLNRGKSASRRWMKQAQAEAARSDSRAVHVTLVHPDPTMRQAVVEAFLLARMPNGSWRPVWQTRHALAPEARPEIEERIREDEQMKALLEALSGLGQQEAVEKAIRFGAATLEAQRLVEADYVRWRDPFFDDLRTPSLR